MAHSIIEEIGHILPPSRNLAETLARAADYATQQAHPEVTLEHLLLALTEDPDAARVLAVSAVDIDQLKGDVSSHLGRLEDRSATGGAAGISTDLRQILEASAAAARGRRDAIDGAIVLAAIVGDGRSAAAHMLRAHGLTFEEAIKALQSALEEAPEEPESPEPEEQAAPLAPDEEVSEPVAASQQPEPPPSYHPPGASADEILASARQRVEGRMGHVPAQEKAEPAPPAPDAEAAHASADASAEAVPEQTAPVVSQQANGNDAAGAVPAQEAEPRAPGPGPRPAPPSKRPRPPGAIREPAPRAPAPPGPALRGDDAGAPQIEAAAAASAVRDAHANATHPASAEDQGRAQFAKETAIDEVLASIRKSGRPVPANADAVPAPAPAAPPAPSAPQWTSAPPREPGRQPAGAQPPARPVPAPGSAPPRPSDRDFFAPGGQSRGNAAAPPLPPQPAAAAGPPRAPLPGLPPLKNGPPGAAPPPPPLAHRPQQHARADQPGMPPMSGPRPSAPAPAAARGGPPDATRAAPGAPPQRPRATDVSVGQMVENIPRSMRVGIPVVVEARIARAEVKALADGLQGGGAVWRHELTVTKAMSVRLRAPDGGFFIETASPETQWIENTLGLITDDYASWRWTVTPRERGAKRLQLVISARTVGTDGLAAETALPDQVVSVKVRVNYAQTAKRVGGWALAAIVGGLLARFGEDLPATVASLMSTIVK